MSKFIGYKNELWKVLHEFEYTGTDQPFTLDPGTYLFICQGGTGGVSTAAIDYVIPPYGGVSYGVIDLNEETTFHAVVGGNGEGTDTTTPGAGGFNGGSAGSISNNTYRGGTGGGGASDIRLLEYDPNEYPSYDENNVMQQPANPIQILYDANYIPDELPEEYTKLDYVEVKQTYRGAQTFISTGYFPNTNTKLIVDFAIYSNFQNDNSSAFYSGGNTAFQCWSRINSSIKLTVESSRYGTDTPSVSNVSFTFNDRLQIEHSMEQIIIRDKTTGIELARNENTGSISGQPDSELVFFTLNDSTSGTRITDTLYYSPYHYCPGRLYEVTIYESDIMVAHLIPTKRNSDNYYGLYDVIREQFYAFYTQSSSYISGGSVGLTYRQLESMYHCGFYDRNGNGNNYSSHKKSYFNTYYTPTPNTEVVYDGVIHSKYNTTNWSCLFGGRASTGGTPPNAIVQTKSFEFYTKCNSQNGRVGYCRHTGTFKTPEDANFTFDQRIKLRCFKETAEWSVGGVVQGSITMDDMVEDTAYCPIYLWIQHTGTGISSDNDEATSATTLYNFKISEVDPTTEERTLVRDFIPCERIQDNQLGLYDMITHTFNPGTDVVDTTVIKGEYVRLHPSIDSRIMVAGGGGGTGQHSDYTSGSRLTSLTHGYACCGGGAESGFVCTTDIDIARHYEPLSEYKANQTSGYHLAYAIQGINKNYAGSGGSGGGWYSGYVSQTFATSDYSYNGMGGSGYVYTNSSYKPEGYNPPSKYQFHDIYMGQGQSSNGKIIIAKLSNDYDDEDTIEFPSVGEMTSMTLKAGKYTLKCYGGDGGYRYLPKNSSRGGFSQGDLSINGPKTIYVSVGGSGFPQWNGYDKFSQYSHSVTARNCPATSWNGGGTPNNSTKFGMVSGGGGTDIRIDGNTLYHRLIVAGGGGGEGTYQTDVNAMRPTDGGGLEGGPLNGSYIDSNTRGTTNGPGTQINSPNNKNASVAGSFGQGGPSHDNGGNSQNPGAGGGGWFGGSGTYSDGYNSDYQKAGCGGSGYVLTEDSYKPEGYQLTSDYYLENAFTVQGGNNLDRFISKTVIEVLEISKPVIAKDSEGYKRFDQTEQEWVLINPQPSILTPQIFETYPDSTFTSDTGLENIYSLYMYDEEEMVEKIKLNVTPFKTIIKADTTMTSDVLDFYVDSTYDSTVFNQNVYTRKENGTVRVYVEVEKLLEGDQEYKLYNIILDGKGGSSQQQSYHYYTAEELALTTDCLPENPCYETRVRPRGEMDDYRDDQGNIETAQWLLPVKIGGSKMIPVEYLNGLYSEGTTDINSAICVEYNRLIYILTSICKSDGIVYMEITTYNPETGRFNRVLHQEGSNIAPQNGYRYNPSFNGLLVDDKYFYVTVGYHTVTRYMTKVYFISRLDGTVTTIPNPDGESDNNRVRCMNGDMNSLKWFDDQYTKFMFMTDSNTRMYIVDKSTRQMTRVDLTTILSNPYSLLSFDRFGDQIVIAYRNSSVEDFYLCSFNKNTNVVLFNTRVGPREAPVNGTYPNAAAFCYADGKYYYVSYGKLRVVDSTTGTVLKTYTVPWGKSGNNIELGPVAYVNGAVAVPDMGTNYFYLFNIRKEMYTFIYTSWTIPLKDRYILRGMLPCKNNMVFYPGGATSLVLTYMGDAKYNIGYKYNKYRIDYTEENIEDFTYDEGFVTFDEVCATISDGYIIYDISDYDTNHITHIDVSKSDYRYTHGVSIVKTEPEPEEEGEPY